MIERLYLKDCLSFREAELEFKDGLIVFTGPSGAGKSVLINSILALFGLKAPQAKISEITLTNDTDLERFGFDNEEIIVVKGIKKEKVRFFLNSQMISKRVLKEVFKERVGYLSQKDENIFKNQNILKIIDDICEKKFEKFSTLKEEFKEKFLKYKDIEDRLCRILEDEKRVNELMEFAKFEIEKIDKISPKIGEYEELLQIKKELSKREKIEEAINRAEGIFEYESMVYEALDKIGKDSSFFDEAMNELRSIFEDQKNRLFELDNIEIEDVLNRLEELSELKRRYGSIEDALEYKEEKIKELREYENLSFEKSNLEKDKSELKRVLKSLSEEISKFRQEAIKSLKEDINSYTKELKLPFVDFRYEKKELDIEGEDFFKIELKGVGFENISSGEFNRLRLALLASWSRYKQTKGQILILDEIDANVSGEESMGIAKILKKLSKSYQIFAISHQAQLSSVANQHFLVVRENEESRVLELDFEKKIDEIARIISGENITKEAKEFARRILSRK
ncbi:AAA family ATPase [Nitrosophilus labii]|uniref:AAA family ATPase n=1 Tax=Nitrosophilus labii TaxID=2706014 RepID=UPI0016574460|nr:AAA family ATPase [Nitrosophilus labii]